MNVALTVSERIKDLREERKLYLKNVAEETGVSKSALGSYETDDFKDISLNSVIKMAAFYGVSTDYLLGVTDTKNHPNTALHELHLSDAAIDFLMSGVINNRLLCEMMTHDNFWRLMADREVYVDRIASNQIDNINLIVDSAREELLSRVQPEERDRYVHTLESAHVNEADYFAHAVHNDIDSIMEDIREAHRKDKTTADDDERLAVFQARMKEALNFTGNYKEKLAHVFCHMMDIPFDKLTDEEVATLAKVLDLSPMLKTVASQRGKGRIKSATRK